MAIVEYYTRFFLLFMLLCPSMCIRIFNATATNITYTSVLLEWETEYEGVSYDDYQYTRVCHLQNQYIQLYTCKEESANSTSYHFNNLRSGKPYLTCFFPVTINSSDFVNGDSCDDVCENIVARSVQNNYTIPGHYGSCVRYQTRYNGWGPQGKAAVIIAGALIFCLIVSQAISFLCPRQLAIESNSKASDDEKQETKSISAEDVELYAQVTSAGDEAIISGDISKEEFNFQGVESDSANEFEWMDKYQYENNGYTYQYQNKGYQKDY